MDEVGTALIAIALVLLAVFVPTAFIGGITGLFYRQFAITIATATAISLFISLTLSPALCAILFKPHDTEHAKASPLMRPVHAFFRGVRRRLRRAGARLRPAGAGSRACVGGGADLLRGADGLCRLVRRTRLPTGFIPKLDRGDPDHLAAVAAGRVAGTHRRGVRSARPMWCSATPGVKHSNAFTGRNRRHLHVRHQRRR